MNTTIPFLDIKETQQPYLAEIEEAVLRVIRRGWYLLGEELNAFECELTQWLGGGYAAGCSNGLDALRLILRAYIQMGRLTPGDEVLLPAGTFVATALAVTDCGLRPRFVDSDAHTLNLSFAALDERINERCKAVIVVHLYGKCTWSDAHLARLKQRGLLLIEDNAQAIGAYHNDCMTGLLGNASAFSFYPTKNVGAIGDAGAVVSTDSALIEMVKALRNYGSTTKYIHQIQGLNCRMDELQAAVLRVKLRHANEEMSVRRELAERYIRGINHADVTLPYGNAHDKAMVWHLFPIITPHRDALQRYLEAEGITTQVHYPIPLHLQPCFAHHKEESYPVAEQIARQELSLPFSSGHTAEQVESVVNAINQF